MCNSSIKHTGVQTGALMLCSSFAPVTLSRYLFPTVSAGHLFATLSVPRFLSPAWSLHMWDRLLWQVHDSACQQFLCIRGFCACTCVCPRWFSICFQRGETWPCISSIHVAARVFWDKAVWRASLNIWRVFITALRGSVTQLWIVFFLLLSCLGDQRTGNIFVCCFFVGVFLFLISDCSLLACNFYWINVFFTSTIISKSLVFWGGSVTLYIFIVSL